MFLGYLNYINFYWKLLRLLEKDDQPKNIVKNSNTEQMLIYCQDLF